MPRETITRRHLPHWYAPGASHFVTFRLSGSLPAVVLEELRERRELLLRRQATPGMSQREHRARLHKQLFAAFDAYLDGASGVSWLSDPRIAALVRGSLYCFNGERYHLHAYAIMSNHVHVLLQPITESTASETPSSPEIGESKDTDSPLSAIMHSLKSYTAHKANEILQRNGEFWQHESYDHWVRDEDELERVVEYIVANPVKAGLAARTHEWHWSSAHDSYLASGDPCGWLGSS